MIDELVTGVEAANGQETEGPTESSPTDAETPASLATFYGQATPATTYWRCELPARYLPGKLLSGTDLVGEVREDGRWNWPKHEGEAAIVQFPGDKGTAAITMVRGVQGERTLIEVDDNYAANHDDLWRRRSG